MNSYITSVSGHGCVSYSMSPMTSRHHYAAVLLGNGKILITGGYSDGAIDIELAIAELYDPVMDAWVLASAMKTTRSFHTATELSDGKILVVGGYNNLCGLAAEVELYDPTTDVWSLAAPMTCPRAGHTATLLDDGRVLVIGGTWSPKSAELYDPAADTWSPVGTMSNTRSNHAATLLNNGRVLVTGGYGDGYLASVELYNPATNSWSLATPMTNARILHTATLLSDGMVLVMGGSDGASESSLSSDACDNYLASVELYDPAANVWLPLAPMSAARYSHTATLLHDGRVLVAGGYGIGTNYLATAELYNPATGSCSPMSAVSNTTIAATLNDGSILVWQCQ